MSNRNFDASQIPKRLRDQNVAQQLYGSFTNAKPVGNPQTVSTQVSIITTEYYPGAQTTVEQSLQNTYTFSPGGIANYVPNPNAGPTDPVATVPGAPTIDSITPGNTIADVYFTAGTNGGSPITDYKYALDSGSGFGPFIPAGTITSPIIITGLINGTTYQVKILAVNAIGDGIESNIQSVTPVAPPLPSGNVFTSPSTNVNVELSGQSPFGGSNYSYNFGSGDYLTLVGDDSWAFGTADFTIEWFQYQTDNRPFPRIFAIGIYPTVSIGCSIEGGTFYAWFPGADSFGSAVPYKNQWVHFAIVRRSGNLYVYKNGIQLSSSITNTFNIANNSTTLYIGVENGGTDPDTQFEGYLTNMRIVKGLAVYTGNFTVPTSSLTLTASANPYGGSNTVAIPAGYTKLLLVPTVLPPSAPQNLTVTPGLGSVNLYFTPPTDDGGSSITNYKYSTDNGASWSFAGTTSSPITVTGLQQNGTLYDVKLLAVNAAGDGAATSAISVAALSTFSPSDIANQNVWLDAQNPSSVILSSGQVTAWNDSSIASNNFAKGPSGTITYDLPSGINSRPALNFTTSAPSLSTYLGKDNFNIAPTNQLTVFLVVRQTGSGVGNSELFFTRNNYQYMDIFNNTNSTGILSANIGSATQRSTGVNIITPPTNTIISFVADSTVDMFVNGSSTLVSSTVRGGLSLNDSTLDWAISGGAFLGNVGELIAYSTPLTTLQRQAVEGYLAWKWGTQDSLPIGHPYKSAPPSITVPNPPTGLGATPGNGQATISFTPGSDGGSVITNYKYSIDGTNYTALSPADTSSPITITGLTNGVTYNITLKAVNAIGDSVASASVSVTPFAPITGSPNVLILGDSNATLVASSLQSAKTDLGYVGTMTITTKNLIGADNSYTGSDLASYNVVILYTNGGPSPSATLGTNLNAFVAGGGHLIMGVFAWGNVTQFPINYSSYSTYNYSGSQSSTGSFITYIGTHPITSAVSNSGLVISGSDTPSITTTTSATAIADYSSDNNHFIAVKQNGSSKLVGINLYFPTGYSSTSEKAINKYLCASIYWCIGSLT